MLDGVVDQVGQKTSTIAILNDALGHDRRLRRARQRSRLRHCLATLPYQFRLVHHYFFLHFKKHFFPLSYSLSRFNHRAYCPRYNQPEPRSHLEIPKNFIRFSSITTVPELITQQDQSHLLQILYSNNNTLGEYFFFSRERYQNLSER